MVNSPTPINPQKKNKSLPSQFIIKTGKWIWTTMWHQMMSKIAPRNPKGEYIRPESQFQNWITSQENQTYPPETGRYRLYVGLGCPWAHRTLIVRVLKGLENVISVALAVPNSEAGIWQLETAEKECYTLPELYQLAQPGYQGRSTVPVLWDSKTQTIVNNESAQIIIMLNSEFNQWATHPELNLYPEDLKETIEQWNEKIYHTVNNGVYRCGFAQSQEAYNLASHQLFTTLNEIDAHLAQNRYLCGSKITLADVRLLTTLFRFDAVYYGLFKCNLKRIQDYPNLGPYLRDLYQLPGVAETCNLEQIKQDYYGNLFPLNPGGIIPLGPDLLSFWEPHHREKIT